MGEPNSATPTIWTGATSTDWTVGTNWSTGAAPTTGTEIRIDDATSNIAVLGVAGASTGVTETLVFGVTHGGSGSLTVQNGSALSTSRDVYLGFGHVVEPGSGHAIDGSTTAGVIVKDGSRWNVGGWLNVGYHSPATLDVFDAATVTAGIIAVANGARGELSVTRATIETSKLGKGPHPALVIFDQGTLRATADSLNENLIGGFSAGQLHIKGGGMTIDDGGFAVSVGCPLSGPGGLTKTGTGTLTLVVHNTYEAGTTIEAGTLEVGEGITGDVAVETGAVLSFACERDFVFGGVISGGGRLEQNGGDNLFLIRDCTHTGGTTVADGSLVLGDQGTTGSIAGDVTIAASASLVFSRSDVYTFAGTIAGAGSVEKNSGGRLVLTAAHTYSGATSIEAGTLLVDGSIASPTTVNAGATLGGRGTIHNDVASAGAIAPAGTSAIGTLTIDGKFTSHGGTLAIDATLGNDGSPSDLLRIVGDAIMGSGPTRVVVANLGGAGAATTGDGIKIVDVGGASAANLFVLDAPVIAGSSAYGLFQGGVANPNDGHWYLRTIAAGRT